jgi:quercetin dioxygenase-like cupin family protein
MSSPGDALPPVRRVVTGFDSEGKSIIESDELLSAAGTGVEKTTTAFNLWKTGAFPADNEAKWSEFNNVPVAFGDASGSTFTIFDVPPQSSSPIHRTVTVDFGYVAVGEVVMSVEQGQEVTLKAGDTFVQRGTLHGWHNRTDSTVRILAVLLPSKPVVVDGKELGLEFRV